MNFSLEIGLKTDLGTLPNIKDIYITLGSEDDNVWFIKVYINPLVNFIWIGVFIMIFSSIIAVLKK